MPKSIHIQNSYLIKHVFFQENRFPYHHNKFAQPNNTPIIFALPLILVPASISIASPKITFFPNCTFELAHRYLLNSELLQLYIRKIMHLLLKLRYL
ncbi:hypothetical protein KFK09_008066 [Dendrobium nobile]|uniref:Uncharacterized protein n=1 Tax=Dendrobium nobile TaxID=94219 RepID=A0A8T3BVV2_DENNO|nr:hypothetical protein KFK09_008066 [Dendrobium nobile]